MALAVGSLHAQIEQRVNIQLSATLQGPTNYNGSIEIARIENVRVTTKDILNLLGDATGNDFSTNSRLIVADFSSIQVASGEDFFDVSGFFANEATSDDVYFEAVNNATGRTRRRSVRTETFEFNDSLGTDFILSGFATETFFGSAIDDDDGSQKISARKTLNAAGMGELNTVPAIFRGTITIRGRGTQ